MTAARIAVYGACGHTGRFVLAELRRRGLVPVACGRDPSRLQQLAAATGVEVRAAAIDDAAALDAAFAGTAAVLHCAGPFLDTAAPVLDAALRARIHYLDVAAVDIAVALDGWHPTRGTRLTGARNRYPRMYIEHGRRRTVPDPAPRRETDFPPPFGRLETTLLPLSESVVVPHHVACRELHAWMNLAPLRDLHDPATPAPTAADASGRSAQRFVVDVRVRRGRHEARATASGRDIYAVTAPLLVEALQRIVAGRVRGCGALAPGQAFDPSGFLAALAPHALTLAFDAV